MSLTEILCIIAIVALLALAIHSGFKDASEWERFRVAHKCKVISHISGTTAYSSGDFIHVPGKTGYLCDDGVTYYR